MLESQTTVWSLREISNSIDPIQWSKSIQFLATGQKFSSTAYVMDCALKLSLNIG